MDISILSLDKLVARSVLGEPYLLRLLVQAIAVIVPLEHIVIRVVVY
jgi:hypothetical protein